MYLTNFRQLCSRQFSTFYTKYYIIEQKLYNPTEKSLDTTLVYTSNFISSTINQVQET